MRISDWSSDVCSSDLGEAIGLQIYTLGSDALKDLDAALGAIAAIGYRTVELMPMADHAPIEVRDALRRAGLVAHGTQTSFVTPSGPNLTTGLAEQIEAARTIRSEEHTSELQSLMRISYAVFCLKKKTH